MFKDVFIRGREGENGYDELLRKLEGRRENWGNRQIGRETKEKGEGGGGLKGTSVQTDGRDMVHVSGK